MAEGVHQGTSEETRDDVAEEPHAITDGLLRPLVPHGDDDTESRGDASLCEAEEKACRDETPGVVGGGHAHKDAAPEEPESHTSALQDTTEFISGNSHRQAHEPGDRQAYNDERDGRRGCKVPEVEHAGGPRVVLADEVEILPES